MFVKKFEADTLDEALKAVKFELGPDAIILKTITNKGLKGAFKKKRIEITAAISERSYEKKAKVDKVLKDDIKEQFYSSSTANVKEAIDGYGQLGLNKMVNTITKATGPLKEATQKTSNVLKNSLDDFLQTANAAESDDFLDDALDELRGRPAPRLRSAPISAPVLEEQQPRGPIKSKGMDDSVVVSKEAINDLRQMLKTQQHRIETLENRLSELANAPKTAVREGEGAGLFQVRQTLKTLEVDDSVIIDLIRKCTYELSREEQDNPDIVFNFALKEMTNAIFVDMPLFSKVEDNSPVVTVLLSEAASGQTSMAMKIGVLKKDVVIIQYSAEGQHSTNADFAAQVFGIKVERVQNQAEMMGISRKATEQGKSVLIDLRLTSKYYDDTKKFIESLRRSFDHVEVLINLSAIHAELYNRKILSRYKDLGNGLIISHVDLCLNFGAIYNIHRANNKLPLKFFGTGQIVPDDIEAASAERVMAGLFQLS